MTPALCVSLPTHQASMLHQSSPALHAPSRSDVSMANDSDIASSVKFAHPQALAPQEHASSMQWSAEALAKPAPLPTLPAQGALNTYSQQLHNGTAQLYGQQIEKQAGSNIPSHASNGKATLHGALSDKAGGIAAAAASCVTVQRQPSAVHHSDDEDEGDMELPTSGSVDYDSHDDTELTSHRVYCRNCTASMPSGASTCPACAHNTADDASLVSYPPQAMPSATASGGSMHAPAALSSQVALLYDERMELHEECGMGIPHPERPDRLRAVMARLHNQGLTDRCMPLTCHEASVEQLAAVHTLDVIKFVQCMAEGGDACSNYPGMGLTSDTYVNRHTYQCARLAAGGAVHVTELVAEGKAAHGAAIIRPPGHHAESNVAMGFCFFNNAAVAARAAQAKGAQRVLILDWDIHHGNGTQHIFDEDDSVMYMSLHRHDHGQFYPGTGAATEVGRGAGEGFTVNVAWDGPGLTNGDYLGAFHHVLLPIAYEFNPDLIIVSAGFDAADGDPVGGCRVTPEAFGHMTGMLKCVAPLVLLLEGGYNLSSTAASTEACLRVLLGEAPQPLPGPRHPSWVGLRGIQSALVIQSQHWRSLRAAVWAGPIRVHAKGGEVTCGAPTPSLKPDGAAAMQPDLRPLIAAPPPRKPAAEQLADAHACVGAAAQSHTDTDPQSSGREYGGRLAMLQKMQGRVGVSKRASHSRQQQLLVSIRRQAIAAVFRRHQRKLRQHGMVTGL